MNARERRIQSAKKYSEIPLDVLCRPPVAPWKIATIRRIINQGGEAFGIPHLQHLFGMNQQFRQLLSRPDYYNRVQL